MIRRLAILLALLLAATPAFAQEKSPAPSPSVESAEKISPVPVPAEMQELLADRDLLSAEIERIVNAEGDAVKIPVSLRTLSARREAKNARFVAWLDAQKIPREWRAAGWRLDKWVFVPPAAAPAVPSGAEGAKPPEKKP